MTETNKSFFELQIGQAQKLAAERGIAALRNPHVFTGRVCGCNNCFCCAALKVYNGLIRK